MKQQFQLQFDRYLYREPYNYQKVVREASRAFGRTIELDSLLGYLGTTISDILKPTSLAVYLHDEVDGNFVLAGAVEPKNSHCMRRFLRELFRQCQ